MLHVSQKRPASAPSRFEDNKENAVVKRMRFFDSDNSKIDSDGSASPTSSHDEIYDQSAAIDSDKSDTDVEIMSPSPSENKDQNEPKSNLLFQPINLSTNSNHVDLNHNQLAYKDDCEEQKNSPQNFPSLSSPEGDRVPNQYTTPSTSIPQG